MILLWGLAGDAPLAAVRTQLAAQRRNALLIDHRAVLETSIDVTVDDGVSGWLALDGVRIDLAQVSAAYVRPYGPTDVPQVSGAAEDSPERRHAVDVWEAFALWTELTPARIVNRLSAQASNGSKPYQAELIRAAGFPVPTTLVTTVPEAVLAFCAEHGDVIYKSVSGVRSIVTTTGSDLRERIELIVNCPTQFQVRVPGTDVRVHVVGDDLFACEAISEAVDYRYARSQGMELTLRRVELPADCAQRCHSLATTLELPFAGIDLRRTPDGEWVCFEANPSPGFTFFDVDGSIARSVAAYLAAAPRGGAA